MTKQVRNRKKQNESTNLLPLIGLGILIPILIIYFIVSVYYSKHFYINTYINGVNVSNMTVSKVEDAINAEVKKFDLTIKGRNDLTGQIHGQNIDLITIFDGSLSNLLEEQHGFLWPVALFKEHNLEIATMIEFDEDMLNEQIDKLVFMQEENIVEPENAYISEYGENGYEIIPETKGAKVNRSALYEVVKNALVELKPEISLEDANCYEVAEITSEDPKLQSILNELNKIAGAKITYEFGEITEVLDGTKISEWLSVDDTGKVILDETKVKEYVDYIGRTYNTFGKTRTLKTSYGDVIQVKGGDYGWWLDRSTEVKQLTELILSGANQVKEPTYFQTAQQYGEDDIGGTYVEVNLTAQHLFFYKDGELILESDFVSGNLSKNYGTPTGTYPIQYKENDAVLRGEDYETPVKYWMPFNGNIGFHDASWRSSFGKDIYKTNGSHGCINMPPENAKILFEHIKRGVAVLVYELPGTENYDTDKDKEKEKTSNKTTEKENNKNNKKKTESKKSNNN